MTHDRESLISRQKSALGSRKPRAQFLVDFERGIIYRVFEEGCDKFLSRRILHFGRKITVRAIALMNTDCRTSCSPPTD